MKLSNPSSLFVGCSDNWENWGVYKGKKEQKFLGMVGVDWHRRAMAGWISCVFCLVLSLIDGLVCSLSLFNEVDGAPRLFLMGVRWLRVGGGCHRNVCALQTKRERKSEGWR